jgi:hypothetical protein
LKKTIVSFYRDDEITTTSGFADLGLFGKLAILDNQLALFIQVVMP